jgi:glucokinase
MNTSTYPRLLGDVGGTNARFAWQAQPGAPLTAMASHLCKDHASLRDAALHHLQMQGLPTPRACAIGIANPVTGDQVKMTNHHWSFSIAALQQALGVERLVVVNDFTALAMALPQLPADQRCQIGGGSAVADAAIAVLGAGTGLGVSGLLPTRPGHYLPINGEGGHVTLAAADDDEAAVIAQLRHRFGHVSAERVLSGPGLVNLYEVAALLAGHTSTLASASDVIAGARAGDALCVRALDLFCAFLGSAAGNLALTLGARGGVFVGGGIAPRILAELDASRFRERFEDKGRFADYLRTIPTWVVTASVSPALLGASRMLDLNS